MLPGYGFFLLIACTAFFYKAAELDGSPRFVTPFMSLALWLSASYFLGWGLLGCFMTQVFLFVAITIWNILTDKRRHEREDQ